MMWRICAAAILSLTSTAMALNHIGPTTTRLQQGQWYVGASYSDAEQDVDFGNILSDHDVEIQDLDTRLILGRVGVGLATDRLEIFGMAGSAEAEWEQGIDIDPDVAMGAGFRATMYLDRQNNLDWGIVGQFLYHNSDDYLYELSIVDCEFGFGPCWRPGPCMLYGGVMIHILDGELDTASIGDDGYRVEDEHIDLEQESWLGIYIGAGVTLAEHVTLMGETQATSDAFGWSAGLQLSF